MNTKILFNIITFILSFIILIYAHWEIIETKSLQRILQSSVRFILFFTSLSILRHLVIYYYKKNKKLTSSESDNFIAALTNLYYIIMFFGVVALFLTFFDIDFKDLITSLSIVAAALAIISKDYLSNIISGLITVFSREVEIDNYIQINNHRGRVKSITLAKVILLNDDGDLVYIPNNNIYSGEFINFSKRKVGSSSIDFELSTNNKLSANSLLESLKKGMEEYDEYILPKSYNLRVEQIKHDFIFFKFQYSLKKPNIKLQREIRKKVKEDILQILK